MAAKTGKIPLWFQWFFAIFMAILVPAYLWNYGPKNFLWLSDVTLIIAFIAVMAKSRLVASMAAVNGLFVETLWIVGFLIALLDHENPQITAYMFDPANPIWVRGLSLFHLFMPILLIWLILRLGYDKRALWIQVPLTWAIIATTWALTNASQNINAAYGYLTLGVHPAIYFIGLAVLIAAVFACTHYFLIWMISSQK